MGWLGDCPFHCKFISKEEAEKRLEQYRTLPGVLDEEELIDMGMAIGYLEALKQKSLKQENKPETPKSFGEGQFDNTMGFGPKDF